MTFGNIFASLSSQSSTPTWRIPTARSWTLSWRFARKVVVDKLRVEQRLLVPTWNAVATPTQATAWTAMDPGDEVNVVKSEVELEVAEEIVNTTARIVHLWDRATELQTAPAQHTTTTLDAKSESARAGKVWWERERQQNRVKGERLDSLHKTLSTTHIHTNTTWSEGISYFFLTGFDCQQTFFSKTDSLT